MNLRNITTLGAIAGLALLAQGTAFAAALNIAGAGCTRPPVLHCPEGEVCTGAIVIEQGPAVEPKTGRHFFLDYPCDLKPGENVTFILSIHGGGSYGNWHRHYFPLVDFVDKHRLVVATPNSPGGSWPDSDDEYLHNIVDLVVDEIGAKNIDSFWVAGHSAGSAALRRRVCDSYFAGKVDGYAATSGGRISPVPPRTSNPTAAPAANRGGGAGGARAGGAAPAGRGGAAAGGAPARAGGAPARTGGAGPGGGALPDCDFSFIYTIGSNEIGGPVPATSDWADKYACRPRVHHDITDEKGGYVYDTSARNTPPQLYRGGPPEGGITEAFIYSGCRDGRIVADFVRMNKGHTQGHEPNVTEEIIKLMKKASGGKIKRAR